MRALALLAVFALAACESADLSRTAATMERSQCRAEAGAYPRAIEECEGIGSAAPGRP